MLLMILLPSKLRTLIENDFSRGINVIFLYWQNYIGGPLSFDPYFGFVTEVIFSRIGPLCYFYLHCSLKVILILQCCPLCYIL